MTEHEQEVAANTLAYLRKQFPDVAWEIRDREELETALIYLNCL